MRIIHEVEEIKDVSSSEKPRLKGQKLCETILEERGFELDEREDDDDEFMDEEDISDSSMNQ